MAKKKVVKIIKLQIPAGKANPAPPVGPSLGAAGVNIMAFCKEFNAKTQKDGDVVLPVMIEVYSDRSFTFQTFQPPVAQMILKMAGVESGSKEPNRAKVGSLTLKQVEEIADKKMPDLRVGSKAAAMQCVKGTARSMGVDIVEG